MTYRKENNVKYNPNSLLFSIQVAAAQSVCLNQEKKDWRANNTTITGSGKGIAKQRTVVKWLKLI